MRSCLILVAALVAAAPAVAQETGILVLRAVDTALVRREADAGRHADIAVDDQRIDRLGAEGFRLVVRAGVHRVRVTLPGYAAFSETVRVERGAHVAVTVRLEPLPVPAPPATVVSTLPEASPGTLHGALAATTRATRVRVELRDGRSVTGTLGSLRTDAFEIADSSGVVGIPYAGVTRYQRRGRATVTGAIVGAIPATIFGVLVGLAASGMCETPGCGDNPVMVAAGVGVTVGALGAGIGAIIGAAIPKWNQEWSGASPEPDPGQLPPAPPVLTTRPDSARAASPAQSRGVGSVTALLTAGYAGYGSSDQHPGDGGPAAGASLDLGFRAGRAELGPEVGIAFGTVGSSWSIAGVSRVDVHRRQDGSRATYIVLGVGAGFWFLKGDQGDESTGLLTGILGVGTTMNDRWRIEARWNPVLQYSDPGVVHPTLVTVGVGRLLAW